MAGIAGVVQCWVDIGRMVTDMKKIFILFLLLTPGFALAGSQQIRSVVMMAKATGGVTTVYTFTVADGPLDDDVNWDAIANFHYIDTYRLKGQSGNNVWSRWIGTAASNNQFSSIALSVVSDAIGPCVRLQDSSSASGYCAYITGSTQVRLVRFDGNSQSTLQTYSTSVATNDILKLSVSGTTLTATINGSALSPSVTDATYTSGQQGIYSYDNAAKCDDFTVGDL